MKKKLSFVLVALILVLAVPGLSGCIENRDTEAVMPENTDAASGVFEGKARIGPTSLGEEIDQPYPEEVYQPRKVMVYDADHAQLITQVDLDENGYYRVELPPGTYTIDINYFSADTSYTVPRKLKIEPGIHVMLDIDFDTNVPLASWLIGEHFYYGQDCVWGDTLVGLDYEYEEGKIVGQCLSAFNLTSHEKKRLLEIPDLRMAGTPSICQNKIVWASVDSDEFFRHVTSSVLQPPPNYDIFLLDLHTNEVMQLTTEEHAQMSPRIYGETIVWLDARNQTRDQYPFPLDVYAYDLQTGEEVRVTENTTVEGYNQVAIDGSTIVWTDMRHADMDAVSHAGNDSSYNNEIYAYDLNTGEERRITMSPKNDQSPDISGNSIVCLRREGFRKANIFLYDLESGIETQVSHSGYAAFSPSIHNQRLAWTDARSSDGNTTNDVIVNGHEPGADIYLFDLETQKELKLTSTKEGRVWCHPVIHGDYMVFQWNRQIGSLVYVMSLP